MKFEAFHSLCLHTLCGEKIVLDPKSLKKMSKNFGKNKLNLKLPPGAIEVSNSESPGSVDPNNE